MNPQTNVVNAPQSAAVQLEDCYLAIEYVEIYVGNILQASHYLSCMFGFNVLRACGSPSENNGRESYMLNAGDCKLMVSADLRNGTIAQYISQHGEGVIDVGLSVTDVEEATDKVLRNGGKVISGPRKVVRDAHTIREAVIDTPGLLVHTLHERDGLEKECGASGQGARLEGERPVVRSIDHIAFAVPRGELYKWVEFYCAVFGFEVTSEESTATELTSMRSAVVENKSRSIKFPIVEPAAGKRRSQIEEFLSYNNGPGVQHIAFLCDDIIDSVGRLKANGVEFLRIPESYYKALPERIPSWSVAGLLSLQQSGVLLDRDEWGDLLQTFTKPITGRPTMFLELVQRQGARGFGAGNIRALFEAVEREQAARGNW